MADTGEEYAPPMLAELFHGFPHLNIAFRTVNSTFSPSSEVYLEFSWTSFEMRTTTVSLPSETTRASQ
ncbi:hypothetical protein J437_LFUL010656 [Ladona fulva]|uniref:Uncharacterized protein n=1 Tax=Ladona fulva TaxID=123851 RepID=A0A8K0KPP3_LADFU|nr:hypothetical protein J437_LFUL010656 [Ladona fulva]